MVMFDFDKALERFMGEKDILIEIIPSYIESLDECIEELQNLDPATQSEKIREVAHSIKGSSLNLDAIPLGKEAESLEHLAYDKKLDNIPEKIKKVAEYVAQTKSELQQYL